MHDRLALLGSLLLTATATTTEHLTEQVVHATATTAFFEAILTIAVIKLTLLLVAQHFVGLLNLLELLFVATTIRMVLSSQLKVGLLDSAKLSVLLNAKSVIELAVVDLLGRTSLHAWMATTAHAGHATHVHLFEVAEGESSAST